MRPTRPPTSAGVSGSARVFREAFLACVAASVAMLWTVPAWAVLRLFEATITYPEVSGSGFSQFVGSGTMILIVPAVVIMLLYSEPLHFVGGKVEDRFPGNQWLTFGRLVGQLLGGAFLLVWLFTKGPVGQFLLTIGSGYAQILAPLVPPGIGVADIVAPLLLSLILGCGLLFVISLLLGRLAGVLLSTAAMVLTIAAFVIFVSVVPA